jgi:hypothetical protein
MSSTSLHLVLLLCGTEFPPLLLLTLLLLLLLLTLLQVENCLTTKAVASEQYIEEIKAMKSTLLQKCPHLARWGLGSNKVSSHAASLID